MEKSLARGNLKFDYIFYYIMNYIFCTQFKKILK